MNDEALAKAAVPLLDYLHEQFPETVGHIPLAGKLLNLLRQVRDAERAEVEAKGFEAGKAAQAILETRGRDLFIADKKKELHKERDELKAQLASAQQERERWRQDFGKLAIERDDLVVALEVATKGKL